MDILNCYFSYILICQFLYIVSSRLQEYMEKLIRRRYSQNTIKIFGVDELLLKEG